MKYSNKVVRKGNSVTLTFQGVDITFEWPYSVLVVAQDADGDVWAYNSVEIYPNVKVLNGIFCHSNQESIELNESSKIAVLGNSGDGNWVDSAVEYLL